MNKQQLIEEISALNKKNKKLEKAESVIKQTEKKLVNSEEKFRALAESSAFAIMMHQGTRWIYANRAAQEISGYTAEELYSMNFWEFVHPDHRELVKQSGHSRQQGKVLPRAYEFKIIKKNSMEKWVSLTGNPIQFEDKPTALISVTDITESKLAEEELKDRQRTLTTLISNLPGFVYRCANDRDWTMEYISDGCREVTGYGPDDYIRNKILCFNDIVHPDFREILWEKWQDVLKKKMPFEEEYPIITKGGGTRWVWERGTGVFSADGQLIFLEGFITDITKRKQAEKSIVESEMHYRTIFENTGTSMILIEDDKTMSMANREFVRNTGYSRDEIIGRMKWTEIVHPDDLGRMIEQHRLRRETPARALPGYEFRLRTKSGDLRNMLLTIDLLPGTKKSIASLIDITESKRVEEALRESEERYRTLVENARDIVFRTDSTGHFTFVNSAGLHTIGYKEEELIGKNYALTISPNMRDEAIRFFGRQFVKGIKNAYSEYPILTKDGREIWVGQNTQLVVEDGRVQGFQSVARDITERKRVEEALQESERKYRTIYEDAVFGIYQTTPEGRFISANAAFASMAGYNSPQELMDSIEKIEPHLYVHSEDRQRFIEIIAAKGMVNGFEVEFYKKDRSTFWTMLNTRAVKDEQGRIIYYEGIASDITYRKQAEAEKIVLEERLNRAEKMEALGTLAGGVAHDLNNVLGVIVGYAELLLNEVDKLSPIRPRLTKIMNGSEKAAAIVQDLLTLARRGVPGRNILNLNKIIADCQKSPEFANLSVHHPSVKIKTALEPELLNIAGSSVHLEKTLYNLISNASEAMAKGGDVTIKTTNQYLDKPIHGYDEIREGDYVVLAVTDTGEGIPSVDLQRIFEPFYTKKVMGRSGTGLGLAVVWGTVKDHQGYINVLSEEGKGSTFTLYFPATRGKISVEAGSISISEYRGKGETILVVDDVIDQRELATEMLKELNYKVVSVASGEAAIDYIKKNKIDLMVLDMIMDPGMDGLDTYMGVLEIQPKQKAIVVSGFSESDRVHAAHALGAGEYVRKPYVIEKLGLAVRKELDRAK